MSFLLVCYDMEPDIGPQDKILARSPPNPYSGIMLPRMRWYFGNNIVLGNILPYILDINN